MPKLNRKLAAAVDEAAGGGDFELLEDGVYEARLKSVTVKEGAKGPYWNWEFELEGEGVKGRKMWTNTSLSENALWKMKEIFTAFGVDPDTDTDEMCGERVRLQIGHEIAKGGSRAGENQNTVRKILPFEAGEDEDEGSPFD